MGDSIIYKILKQGYPATYNFKDDENGAFPEGLTDVSGTDCTVTVIASLDGHRKVLQFYDNHGVNYAEAYIAFSSGQTSGTVEIWCRTSDNTKRSYIALENQDDNYSVQLYFDNGNVYSWDGAASHDHGDFVANIWYHYRIVFDCATDTFDLYQNGILLDSGIDFNNNATTLDKMTLRTHTDTDFYMYYDAIGFSWDANYNVGDNIHWRNYKESTDSFEGDDVGTQGTSITWVDGIDNPASVEIVQEFNEHKKILRKGVEWANHNFASQSKNGWVAFWAKVSDVTGNSVYGLYEVVTEIIKICFDNSKILYYDGNAAAYQDGPAAVNDTWYLIYIKWVDAANDYYDFWVNNILIASNVQCTANMTSGITRMYIFQYDAGDYLYLDAPTSSLDSDKRADNRTLEYHPLSKTDITNKCSGCSLTKSVTTYATCSIETVEVLGNEHYLQIIDGNSDLRFIGNRFKDIDIGISINGYFFQDLNKVELETEDSYTASSAEDVNASLLNILTNVGQADGRLIYHTVDDPAGNLTPNYRNKPRHMITRILAIRGGKKCIIKASGKLFLDDDANPDNGAATITETSSELMGIPMIDEFSHQINYVEVRGGIDPDKGTPFSGVSEDATAQADGTGIIPYYKRLRELQSDIDCQNVAIAIRENPNFSPQILRIRLRGIYADPGEVINIEYPDKSFTATNCYVDGVKMNVLTGVCNYSLNTGIFDRITFNMPGYTMADETADDIAETLYSTDITTVSLYINPYLSVHGSAGIECATDKGILTHFPISSKVDITRDITIIFTFTTGAVGGATIDGELFINRYAFDGSADKVVIEDALNWDYITTATWGYIKKVYTLSASDLVADSLIYIRWMNVDATTAVVVDVQLVYYQKRNV